MAINTKIYLLLALPVASFLFSCGGGGNNAAAGSNLPLNDTALGEIVYKKTCLVCHQANGEGLQNTFPPLAKSDYITDKSRAIHQVIKGSSGEITVNGAKFNSTMPPQSLTDEEIAQVLTYVYASWGNNGPRVTVDEVKAERGKN